ncbi:hypothetical protein J6590_030784 [Homalodisca vitripennis]|nr:hypothetical protein J6590_030784 [Homalodisca vitripennis]
MIAGEHACCYTRLVATRPLGPTLCVYVNGRKLPAIKVAYEPQPYHGVKMKIIATVLDERSCSESSEEYQRCFRVKMKTKTLEDVQWYAMCFIAY